MDKYGSFVNSYVHYTHESGMEAVIGRHPALEQFSAATMVGATVLDFGCGPATNAAGLYARGASEVVGIDVDAKELAVARAVDPKGTYLHYDGVGLAKALGGRVFDCILASFSFCVIPTEALALLVNELRQRLANRGAGELVIVDPNFEYALGAYYPGQLHYHPKPGVQSNDYVHVTLGEGEAAVELYHDVYRTHEDLLTILREAGFADISISQPVPSEECSEPWAQVAQKVPPFIVITAR